MRAAPIAVPAVCGPLRAMLVAAATRPWRAPGVTRWRSVVKATIVHGIATPTTTAAAHSSHVDGAARAAKPAPSMASPTAIDPRSPRRAMTAAAVMPPAMEPAPLDRGDHPEERAAP